MLADVVDYRIDSPSKTGLWTFTPTTKLLQQARAWPACVVDDRRRPVTNLEIVSERAARAVRPPPSSSSRRAR
jgi:hypothetical protein